jgi:HSP20 family protein
MMGAPPVLEGAKSAQSFANRLRDAEVSSWTTATRRPPRRIRTEEMTMLNHFNDFGRSFATMDHLRRNMDRLFEELEPARQGSRDVERMWSGRFPRLSFVDNGASMVLEADVPGLADKDVQLTIHQDTLTLTGERGHDAPQGWFVHRQERAPVRFSRSFALPCKVDPEKSTATLKNGVLTITLAKATEAQPKQIAIKAQ